MFHVIFSKSSHIDISQHKADLVKVKKSCLSWIFPLAACWPRGQVGLVRLVRDINGGDFYLSPLWQHPCNCPHNMFPFPSQYCSPCLPRTQSSSLYYHFCDNWRKNRQQHPQRVTTRYHGVGMFTKDDTHTYICTYTHMLSSFTEIVTKLFVGFLRFTLRIWEIIHDFNNYACFRF